MRQATGRDVLLWPTRSLRSSMRTPLADRMDTNEQDRG